MKISGKKSSILFLVFILGIQPIANYAVDSSAPKERTLANMLKEGAILILSTIFSTYFGTKLQLYMQKDPNVEVPASAKKTITFKDYIGVPQEAINLVDQLKNPEKYEKMSISIPRGILLTGDPGVGKTYLAQAIAGEVDCPFLEYSATTFSSKFFGESEKNIRNAFQAARDAAKKSGK